MVENLIRVTQTIVYEGGALGVFLAAVLEEIVFFIPSSIVPMTAGFFLLADQVAITGAVNGSIWYIAIPVGLGLALGSLVPYYICYFGGQPVIERWGRFIGLSWDSIQKTEQAFIRGHRDELVLFGLRVLPFVPNIAISGFCGVIQYPVRTFIVITALGGALRAFFIGLVGWYAGETYFKYAQSIAQVERYAFILISIVVGTILVWLIYRKKNKNVPIGESLS